MTAEPRDVWCSRCPAPATRELVVTDGVRTYTAAYCGRCIARVTLQSRPKEAHRDVRTDHR